MKESMDAGLSIEIESFVQNLVGEGELRLEEKGEYIYSAPGDLGENFARIYGNLNEGELGIEVFAPSATFNVAVVADKIGFRAAIHIRNGEEDNNTFLIFGDKKVYIYGHEKVGNAFKLEDSIWHANVESLSSVEILPDDTKKVGDSLAERLAFIEQTSLTLKESQDPKRS